MCVLDQFPYDSLGQVKNFGIIFDSNISIIQSETVDSGSKMPLEYIFICIPIATAQGKPFLYVI